MRRNRRNQSHFDELGYPCTADEVHIGGRVRRQREEQLGTIIFDKGELDFDSWVERIGTPEPEISALRRMLDRSPAEVREALALGSPGAYDFAMPVALIQGS